MDKPHAKNTAESGQVGWDLQYAAFFFSVVVLMIENFLRKEHIKDLNPGQEKGLTTYLTFSHNSILVSKHSGIIMILNKRTFFFFKIPPNL